MSNEEFKEALGRFRAVARSHGHELIENEEDVAIAGRPFRIENRRGKTVCEGSLTDCQVFMVNELKITTDERKQLRIVY